MEQKGCWGYLVPCAADCPPLELRQTEVTAGRDPACDVVLQGRQLGCKQESISKHHFRLLCGTQGAVLKDDSKSGTFVNGRPVGRGKQAALPHGARIDVVRPGIKAFVFLDKSTSDGSNYPKSIKDKYVLGNQLGAGGFGQVFLVLHKAKLQRYAMKMVRNTKIAEREAEILREIRHPCMIHACEIFRNADHLYLVLEYIAGGDLSRWVNDKKLLNEKQTKLLFYQLSLAVQYMHQNSITHRDLKPANILMVSNTPHSLIKVTDFGLAKDEELHSDMTTCAGTEIYLAPEVMISTPYTNKVDIWNMGVILYYSLSGVLPFHSLNEARRFHYHVMYTADKWRHTSLTALELVKRMLEVSPERRASINEVLATTWLQDESMKKEAHSLMGLHTDKKPEPSRVQKPILPAINNAASPVRHIALPTVKPNAVSPVVVNVPAHAPNRPAVSPRGVLQYLPQPPKPVPVQQPQVATPLREVKPVRIAAIPPVNQHRYEPVNRFQARSPASPVKKDKSPVAVSPYRPGHFAAGVDLKPPAVHKAHNTVLMEARKNLKHAPWKP